MDTPQPQMNALPSSDPSSQTNPLPPSSDPTLMANFSQWKQWVDSVIASGQNVQPGMAAPAQSSWLSNLNLFKGGKSRRRSRKSKRSKSRRTRR